MEDNLYEILDINKTATQSEIKKAYRKLSKKHHPDVGGDEEEFKKVSYAYEILSNDDKKNVYDTRGHDGLNHHGRGNSHGYHDDFMDFMRQASNQQEMNHASIKVQLNMSLKDAFNGKTAKFKYNRTVKCDSCNGKGGSDPKMCPSCNGKGRVVETFQSGHGYMQQVRTCDACHGKGVVFKDTCKACHGNGAHNVRETMEVKIPHGYLNGETIIEPNKGHIMGNGGYGPLIMIISIQNDDDFKIMYNYDLISKIKLPYETFVLGGEIMFTTIDNKKIKLKVPELSKIGNKLKISNMGLKRKGDNGDRGDQYLILDIILPDSITYKEKVLLKKLKNLKE